MVFLSGKIACVPIFLAALAVRQQSQTIRFRTAAEMLETFGMHKGGKQYRRLVGAFERVFGATILFSTDTQLGTAKVRVLHIAKTARIRRRGPARLSRPTPWGHSANRNTIQARSQVVALELSF
jgi:hypothetical protein